jgi:transposase
LHRWRNEAGQAGRAINRIVVAYEAGRDGFWLARWLRARDVEAYVIHPASVAVSHEHRRAKTDRLDTELLMRALLGWLRGARAERVKPEGNKLARVSIQSAGSSWIRPRAT